MQARLNLSALVCTIALINAVNRGDDGLGSPRP